MSAYASLCEMRRQGLKPGAPVHVAFTDPAVDGLTLHPAHVPDWRALVGLEVIVWADPSTPFVDVARAVVAIARARPAELQLCFLYLGTWHLIDCGSGRHMPALLDIPARHEFQWQPVNLGGTAKGYQIKAALHQTLKPGAYL